MKDVIYVVMHSVPTYQQNGEHLYETGYSIKPHPMRAFYDEDDAKAWIESHYRHIEVEFDTGPDGYSSGFRSAWATDDTYKIKYTIQEVPLS